MAQTVQCTQHATREYQTAEEQNRLDMRKHEHIYCVCMCVCVCVCVCVYIYIYIYIDDVSFVISPAWRHMKEQPSTVSTRNGTFLNSARDGGELQALAG